MILTQIQRRSSKVPQKGIRTKVQQSVRDSDEFQDFRAVQMESRQDVELLMNKVNLSAKAKNDFFSDSEDEFCTLRDDQEEFSQQKSSIFVISPRNQVLGSFGTLVGKKHFLLSESVKHINTFEIAKVSRNRSKVPRFGQTPVKDTPQVFEMRFNQTEKLTANHLTDYDSTIIEQSSSERN